MAFDLVPGSLWRFPRFPSLWDEEDGWLTTTSGSGLTISEDDKNVYVETALPGLDSKDIEVTYDKGILWIRGEAKEEEEDKKKKYYHRASKTFSYKIAVPGDIDPNKDPDAAFKNGVMKITFSKSPKTQPKKINVKSG